MAYYYESLQTHYGGKVRNVPHPHIRKETENFRNRQDRVNNFLNRYLVKTSDGDAEMSMEIVKEKYIKWHESQYPGTNKEYQRHAIDQLENSKIQVFIKKSNRGNFLKGYRVLDLMEEAADDESYYNDIEKNEHDFAGIKSESAIQMIARMRAEFDKSQSVTKKSAEPKIGKSSIVESKEPAYDTDSDIEDMVKATKNREPNKASAASRKYDKVDLSHLDNNGIKKPAAIQPVSKKPTADLKEYAKMGGRESSDDEVDEDDEDDEIDEDEDE